MQLLNKTVHHKAFGDGTVTDFDGEYLSVKFDAGIKRFLFPDSFESFLSPTSPELADEIKQLIDDSRSKKKNDDEVRIQERKDQLKTAGNGETRSGRRSKSMPRANVAFKCNYCDGGHNERCVGFDGVCSDEVIRVNIESEHRTWCATAGCACKRYMDGEISREQLDALDKGDDFVCYESQILRNWKAMAGVVQSGSKSGEPMKLNRVQRNSLCVLTTRDHGSGESKRYIFAVFMVDEAYEGSRRDEGYVSTRSKFKLALTPDEAHSMLFWNYHANQNQPAVAAWSSGLHRYFGDTQAAMILRDIAKLKEGTPDETLAKDFFSYFCRVNNVNPTALGIPNGALQQLTIHS